MIDLVVYGDFNCPFSALASQRAAVLEERGLAQVEWRAVEHDQRIPAAGLPVVDALAAMLAGELDQIRELLAAGEPDRLRLPPRQVNTALAVRRFAGTAPGSRAAVRAAIFAAHWERGEPVDDAATLDRLGAGEAAPAVVADWSAAWRAATTPLVPVMVLPDGYVSRGLGALKRLATMLDG